MMHHPGYDARACSALWRMVEAAGAPAPHREFAIAYLNKDGKEKFQRHISFETVAEFEQFVRIRKPVRLDVGPAYAVLPSVENFYPRDCQEVVLRETKFDIDIGDYDKPLAVRTCCKNRDTCPSCWGILAMGCAIIDAGLRGLGANTIAWFYSGGRGMHCWVLDRPSVTFSTPEAVLRATVFERVAPKNCFDLLARAVLGGDCVAMEIITRGLLPLGSNVPLPSQITQPVGVLSFAHPRGSFLGWYAERHPCCAVYTLRKRVAVAEKESPEDRVLRAVASELCDLALDCKSARRSIRDARAKKANGQEGEITLSSFGDKFAKIEAALQRVVNVVRQEAPGFFRAGTATTALKPCVARAVAEAALWCMMPRVDSAVTDQQVHLLKAPLSVHGLTQKLAVRVEASELLAFRPERAPKRGEDGRFTDEAAAERAFADFDAWSKRLV